MTRVELRDGSVLFVYERASDLEALVARGAPGQVGLTTRDAQVLVSISAIRQVAPT